jgi:cell division protein FtsX
VTGWAIVRREIRRNLNRNKRSALTVVLAVAIAGGLVALVAEWWVLVGRAAIVAAGTGAAVGVETQKNARIPLLAAAVVIAEIIGLTATIQATRRRRRSEFDIFERILGAPNQYTKMPALAEGLIYGIIGGVLAATIAVAGAPILTRGERSTVPSNFTITDLKAGHPTQVHRYQLAVRAIQVGAAHEAAIAAGVLGLSAVLGIVNTTATLRTRRTTLPGP